MTTIQTADSSALPAVLADLAERGVDVSALTVSGVECTAETIADAQAMCQAAGCRVTIALAQAEDAPRRRGRKS